MDLFNPKLSFSKKDNLNLESLTGLTILSVTLVQKTPKTLYFVFNRIIRLNDLRLDHFSSRMSFFKNDNLDLESRIFDQK